MSFYYNDNNGMYPRFLAEDNFSNATDDFLTSEEVHEEDHIEPRTAMLFPWFFQLVGIFAFFFLSRYLRALPYTAVLFLLGMCAGRLLTKLCSCILFCQYCCSFLLLTPSPFLNNPIQ